MVTTPDTAPEAAATKSPGGGGIREKQQLALPNEEEKCGPEARQKGT